MSNRRINQKQALKVIIESITYNSKTFTCHVNRQTEYSSMPCFVVSNAGIIPNIGGKSIMTNMQYFRGYTYYIDIITEANLKINQSEKENVHEALEELLLDKLQSRSTRSANPENWQDLRVESITSPYSLSEKVLLSDMYYQTTFTIVLDTIVNFEQ